MTEKQPTMSRLRLLKILRSLQTLFGIIAVIMIPVLWAAWSRPTLALFLGIILGSVALFTALSHYLHGPLSRGEL